MNNYRTTIALISALALSGCVLLSSDHPALSDGLYTMESSIKKTGVARDYGGSSECRVTIHNTTIRIDPVGQRTNAWLEGTLTGHLLVLAVKQENPDPMVEAMQLRQVYEGRVTANNVAEGTMRGYAGTNAYLNGTWKLTKAK